jgi:hypothetical protein
MSKYRLPASHFIPFMKLLYNFHDKFMYKLFSPSPLESLFLAQNDVLFRICGWQSHLNGYNICHSGGRDKIWSMFTSVIWFTVIKLQFDTNIRLLDTVIALVWCRYTRILMSLRETVGLMLKDGVIRHQDSTHLL